LSSSRYSIVSLDSLLRSCDINLFAELKTHSTSADIAGIDKRISTAHPLSDTPARFHQFGSLAKRTIMANKWKELKMVCGQVFMQMLQAYGKRSESIFGNCLWKEKRRMLRWKA
jgi:hypothetical protein